MKIGEDSMEDQAIGPSDHRAIGSLSNVNESVARLIAESDCCAI
jgi:hypothetical protein